MLGRMRAVLNKRRPAHYGDPNACSPVEPRSAPCTNAVGSQYCPRGE